MQDASQWFSVAIILRVYWMRDEAPSAAIFYFQRKTSPLLSGDLATSPIVLVSLVYFLPSHSILA